MKAKKKAVNQQYYANLKAKQTQKKFSESGASVRRKKKVSTKKAVSRSPQKQGARGTKIAETGSP